MDSLSVETAVTEEETAEGLESALGMEVEEEGEGKGEEGGDGTSRALVSLELLTQKAEPSRTMLIDACNGFNKTSLLAMLWNAWHLWPARVRTRVIPYNTIERGSP